MNTTIPKGTVVRILTTNGGDITAPLLEKHRATYDAVIGINDDHYAVIPSYRIKSITPV